MWFKFMLSVLFCFVHPFGSGGVILKKPHILFFYVDDLGWNDVGFHGMTQIPTPNIDALASDGIILNNYYVPPICTPSRASLMTGKYPSTTGNQHVVIYSTQAAALGLEHKTLPQVLNGLGYVSRMVGKWHLGFFKKEYTPICRGFASHYGFWNSGCDFFFHTGKSTNLTAKSTLHVPNYDRRDTFEFVGLDFRDNFRPITTRTGEYLTDLYTEEAVNIIQKHHFSKPLFLYLAHHGVHLGDLDQPMRAPEKYTRPFGYIQNVQRKNFAGALSAIDKSLGLVLDALERRRMLKDTIIIFSTDNGSPKAEDLSGNGGSNYPLRGFKVTGWEGGTRGSAFIWTPRLNNASRTFDGLMHISDWMPTLYQAAGGNVNDLKDLDGQSMWDAFQNGSSPRQDVLLVADPIWNITSYRYGDFKLLSGSLQGLDDHGGEPGREKPPSPSSPVTSKVATVLKRLYGRPSERVANFTPVQVDCGDRPKGTDFDCNPEQNPCLFNIKEDPCEYRNLAGTHPEVMEHLQSRLKVLEKRVQPPWYPEDDYRSNPLYHGGFWAPWLDSEENYHAQD